MPVAVLDVPIPAWNEVVIQAVIHGLDMEPDYHRAQGNTIVELTGTHEKLNQVLTQIDKKIKVEVLDIVESKSIE